MMGGYNNKMLFVNLTQGELEERKVPEEVVTNFIGGYGLGAKILYEMMPAGADPLGPDNVLGFIPGPAPGTRALFSGRYTLVHKSPVTGGWNDANSGGYFGPELKKPAMTPFSFPVFLINRCICGLKTDKQKLRMPPTCGEWMLKRPGPPSRKRLGMKGCG